MILSASGARSDAYALRVANLKELTLAAFKQIDPI